MVWSSAMRKTDRSIPAKTAANLAVEDHAIIKLVKGEISSVAWICGFGRGARESKVR